MRLGLRPSEIQVDHGEQDLGEALELTGRVRLAERLGRQIELTVDVAGTDLIVVDAAELRPAEGDQVRLRVPLHQVHVFAAGGDGEETERLGAAAPRPAKEAR